MRKTKMSFRNSFLIIAMMMLCSANLWAQQKSVSGVVKEANGEPIIGASILVKGTTVGTSTDVDGQYKLNLPDGARTLVFSFVGMTPKEIAITGEVINAVLESSYTDLDEVVVIGYGTVKKRDLTGSVASVSSKQLENIPVANVSEALTGKLPGVSIVTTEGSPDADIKIRVRGGGSLSQDNSPLYIVDGFEVQSISDIAPSEIQTIDVLKDASSTAIYGSRGANGVIIVTTKSGQEGKIQVTLDASHGYRKATKLQKSLSPYEFAMYQYELGSTDYGVFEDMDIWRSMAGTDYQNEIFGHTGQQTQYNVNVSGGTKETKFNISYAHNDEKSIMLGSGFNKDNISAKINTNITPALKMDFNARFSYQTVTGLSGGADTNESNAANSIVANSIRFRPVYPLSSGDDDEESSTWQYSPLERINATYKEKTVLNQTYNAGLTWKITKQISARSEFGYGWKYTDTDQVWETPATQNAKLNRGKPQAAQLSNKQLNWRNSNTLTYDNKKLFTKDDALNFLIGHEVSSSQSTIKENMSVDFPANMKIDEILAGMGNGTALPNKSYINAEENMLSFFGRLNYTLADKYLFTTTIRTDGSNKFAKGNQWGVFPSAAIAWRISDEAFMLDTQSWLSNLKARLSFGTAGNNRIKSGLLSTIYMLSENTDKAPYFNDIYNVMLEHESTLANPNLKWETTVTRNLGVDYGFWNNRLVGALDFYWNTTKDLLMQTEIPSNSGYRYQYQNFGQTSNKGVELSLSTVLIDKKDFGLEFNFNVSYNKSRIDKLALENPWQNSEWAGSTIAKYEDYKIEEGGRLGEIWGYKTNGFYTVYDNAANPTGELEWTGTAWRVRSGIADNSATITGGSPYPGGLKLECDENGDPLKQRLGNTIAPVYGGFGLNSRFKNFDLSAFFNYSIGNQIVNGTKLATSFYAGSSRGHNLNSDFASGAYYTWIDPQTGLNLGRGLGASTLTHYGGIDNVVDRLNEINANASIYNPASASTMQLTDYAVENASFLRVNNVSLGYSLPKALTTRLNLQTVRVYATGYNLWVFTNYSGTDPEVDTSSKRNAMTPGIDYASYPKSRSFVCGINIMF